MTWAELDEVLNKERQRFPRAENLLEIWEQPGCVFELLERQTSAKLDAAIHEFSRSRQWPELTADEKTMLGFRLDFGWHLVTSFCGTDRGMKMFPTDLLTDKEQVEWALVDAWQWPGYPFWQRCADLAAGREPHDPLE